MTLTPLERLEINIKYGLSERQRILLELLPDASNISDVCEKHNIPVEIVRRWYNLSERVFGAYGLDRYRNPGFLLAEII